MFIDISQLKEVNGEEYNNLTQRWYTQEGIRAQKYITDLIKQGGGEDFLQRDIQYGVLKGFLEDEFDLKGINLYGVNVNCPKVDNFQRIDFSYSKFIQSNFNGCTISCNFYFVQFKRCKFINCTFAGSYFIGCFFQNCTFENVDFIQNDQIVNCEIEQTDFVNFFSNNNLLKDCKIFNSTQLDTPKKYPNGNWDKLEFDQRILSDFYTEVSLGYKETKSLEKSSNYRYLARKAYTRYNVRSKFKKWIRILINEFVIGYGEKPFNILRAAVLLIIIFGILYQLFGLMVIDTSKIISYKINPLVLVNESWNMDSINQTIRDYSTSLYFSMRTFLIIGVDNIQTTNIAGTVLVIIQSFLGITLIGACTAVLLKKIMQ